MSDQRSEPRGIAAALYSEDAEQAVIGAAMMDEACIPTVRALLASAGGSAAFYRVGHGLLWDAMCALLDHGSAVDPVTLSDQLMAEGTLDRSGGKEYIGYLVDAVPTSATVAYHAAIVVKCAARRRVCMAAADAIDAASAPGSDPSAVANAAVTSLVSVATAGSRGAAGFVKVSDDLWRVMESLERGAPEDGIVGVPTGWSAFDEATGGALPGELVVFCAVPGGCKTVSLVNIATYNALGGQGMRHGVRRDPVPVGFVSAEMTRDALIKRVLCNLAEVDSFTLRTRRFRDRDFPRLTTAAGLLAHAPLYLDESPAPSMADLMARVRGLKAQHPEIGALCVDYIQLISGADDDNRAEEIRAVAKQLKALAKELQVPIFTAAQVNDKDTERRKEGSKKPGLADIQGSSGIRQAADVIVLQHRPSVYGESTGADVVQMDVAKNRELPPFYFELDAELRFQRLVPARLADHGPERVPSTVLPFPGHDTADPSRRAS